MKRFFFIFISLLSVVFCNAKEKSDFQLDEILYAINGSEVTVVGQTSAGYKMTEVTIPETVTYKSQTYTVTKIGTYSFLGNKNLVKLKMGDGVKAILESAFEECRNLKRITLSKTLEVIYSNAFYECVNLDSLVLPATMKQLGTGCFAHCSRLKDIFCLSKKSPEFISYAGFTSFGYLHVPKGCKKAYDDYGYWQYLYDVIDDIDPENFDIDNKKDKDSDDGSNKDNDLNKDGGSGNIGTDEGSNSSDRPDPDKDKDEENGSSTAISEFSTTQSQTAYSLSGIRLNTPVKGINIVNGKKLFVK